MSTPGVPDPVPSPEPSSPEERTEPSADPLVSMRLGEFIIEERIGAGGMGIIYRAVHPLIGKHAAIKVLRAERMARRGEEQLLLEAKAVNAIRHPGILDIFNCGTLPDGRPYIVMELLQGRTLSEQLIEKGKLDVELTVWVLDQLLSALGAVHRAGVVHRDLNPENVFLVEVPDTKPTLKLVDFGIAQVPREESPGTNGAMTGTPECMSPEQIRGGTVGPAADLYSVGILAFQMLTGARPFQGEHMQVMFAQVETQPPAPSTRAEGIPPALDALVLQLLEKKPARRPATAEAARQQLSAIEAALRIPSAPTVQAEPVPVPAALLPAPAMPRRYKAVLGAAVLMSLGVGIVGGRAQRQAAPEQQPPPAPVARTQAVVAPAPVPAPAPVMPPEEEVAPQESQAEGALQEAAPPERPSPPRPARPSPKAAAPNEATEASSVVVATQGPPVHAPHPARTVLDQRLAEILGRLPAPDEDTLMGKRLREELLQIQQSVEAATSERQFAYLGEALDLWERRRARRMETRSAVAPTPGLEATASP
ncbi:serine/threonine-protein kinase [Corallococcus soli]|uniref:serine/threonine-protein kinase n=1 Tax=Corallococcus soli TaxID=2710757 RepID=UPI001D05541F|nr:serine/threonine-protein kinase [Corallococcus soli]